MLNAASIRDLVPEEFAKTAGGRFSRRRRVRSASIRRKTLLEILLGFAQRLSAAGRFG
jgi:hypothetical protein